MITGEMIMRLSDSGWSGRLVANQHLHPGRVAL